MMNDVLKIDIAHRGAVPLRLGAVVADATADA
jgi:hypothetical protein